MKKHVKDLVSTWKTMLMVLLKWLVLGILVGVLIGGIACVFAYAITWATSFRQMHPKVVLGMPIGGLLIVFMYRVMGQKKNAGTNMVLKAVRSSDVSIPGQVTPLILLSTVITHLFGGSSGREGAALQFGASVGDVLARQIHLNESDKKIIILASMSAAFSALFGTPMAAVIFPMEVISVGVLYYAALVPCVFASFTAQYVALFLKVHTLDPAYLVPQVPDFYSVNALKCIVLALACALAGALFCLLLHNLEHYFEKWLPNPYLRVMAGAAAVIILCFVLKTDAYLGLGGEVISGSFIKPAEAEMFLMKMIFTCLTLCVGFKGGEIVPTLFIGATLGSALSVLLKLPCDVCAACGMVGVFCAVTNCPVASLLIAFEMFGFAGMPYFCVVVALSYLMSGYHSLYKEQKIVYSKTENKFINRKSS